MRVGVGGIAVKLKNNIIVWFGKESIAQGFSPGKNETKGFLCEVVYDLQPTRIACWAKRA
jgi:hypothetical protein